MTKKTAPKHNATFTARVQALRDNLARLQARNGDDAGKDLEKMLTDERSVFFFSEHVNAQIDAWGLDVSQVFSPSVNPKVTKRFVQFVGAVQRGEYKNIDRTTACILLGLHLAGDFPLTADALWSIGTGGRVKTEGVSPETRGVSTRTVARLVGSVSHRTIGTQLSRSVGKNGFLQLVGATKGEPGKVNQVVSLNRAHPMVTAFIDMIGKATEGQLSELVRD